MTVTSVRFDKLHPKESGVCAECSIVLDDELCIHKVLIIRGLDGEFVAFPHDNYTKLIGERKRYNDLVHPTRKELTASIKNAVLECYYKSI